MTVDGVLWHKILSLSLFSSLLFRSVFHIDFINNIWLNYKMKYSSFTIPKLTIESIGQNLNFNS